MPIWIVEAVDKTGKTLWREVYTSDVAADRRKKAAEGPGLRIYCWMM